jgi:hypothetical protein
MLHYADFTVDIFVFNGMEMIRRVASGIEHNRMG